MRKFKKGDRVVMVDVVKAKTEGVKLGSKGTVLTVNDVNTLDVFVNWDDAVSMSVNGTLFGCKKGHGWWVNHEGLDFEKNVGAKPMHVIVMKYDGKKTTAIEKVYGEVVAKAEANRNPSDADSSSVGFKLAFSRLMDEFEKVDEAKKKNMKPKFSINDIRVGDLVKLRDDLEVGKKYGRIMLCDSMKNHDFMKVTDNDGRCVRAANGYWYSLEMIGEVFHPASC